VSQSPEFQKGYHRAFRNFARELRDGCVDCLSEGKRGYCWTHRRVVLTMITRPRSVPEFQAYLKAQGLLK
jgi:hypothetical protein